MKSLRTFVAVLLTMTSVLAGCQTNVSQNDTQKAETKIVKIGVVAPMSGPCSNYGEDAVQVYQYFVDKFNASHADLQVKLVIEDGKCEGASATSAAHKLISIDGVKVMLGGLTSSEAVAAGQVAQANKVFSIVAGATEAAIGEIGDYVYRLVDEKTMMESAAKYLESENANNILIIVENESSAVTEANALKENYNGNSDTMIYQSSEQDFSIIAKQVKEKLKNDNIDYLVMISLTNEVKINLLQALDQEGIVDQMNGKMLGNELWNSSDIIEAFGDKLNGFKIIQLASVGDMDSKATLFLDEYLKNHTISTDPYLTVLEGEAVSLLLDAINEKGYDADKIKEYINSLNESNLRSGLFGQYYFGGKNQAIGLQYLIYEMYDGVSTPIF